MVWSLDTGASPGGYRHHRRCRRRRWRRRRWRRHEAASQRVCPGVAGSAGGRGDFYEYITTLPDRHGQSTVVGSSQLVTLSVEHRDPRIDPRHPERQRPSRGDLHSENVPGVRTEGTTETAVRRDRISVLSSRDTGGRVRHGYDGKGGHTPSTAGAGAATTGYHRDGCHGQYSQSHSPHQHLPEGAVKCNERSSRQQHGWILPVQSCCPSVFVINRCGSLRRSRSGRHPGRGCPAAGA